MPITSLTSNLFSFLAQSIVPSQCSSRNNELEKIFCELEQKYTDINQNGLECGQSMTNTTGPTLSFGWTNSLFRMFATNPSLHHSQDCYYEKAGNELIGVCWEKNLNTGRDIFYPSIMSIREFLSMKNKICSIE